MAVEIDSSGRLVVSAMTDAELWERPSSLTAKEIERRTLADAMARRRGARPEPVEVLAEARWIAVTHGGGGLLDAWAPRGPHAAARAVVSDRGLVQRSAQRVAANNARFAQGLFPRERRDELTVNGQPRQTGMPGDPWRRLVSEANGAARADRRADHGPAVVGDDPDTTEAERRALGGESIVVARMGGRR